MLFRSNAKPPVLANDWWQALIQRYTWRNVDFAALNEPGEQSLAAELFDNVADNLIDNALRKTSEVRVTFDPESLTLVVTDSGDAIPTAVARELFNAPLPSPSSLGVGLYHASRLAAQHGFALALAHNEPGRVSFRLAMVHKKFI
mgnify:CR=1 FL=1